MRRILRNMAKIKMKKHGMKKICKDKKEGSYFSNNWRYYILRRTSNV